MEKHRRDRIYVVITGQNYHDRIRAYISKVIDGVLILVDHKDYMVKVYNKNEWKTAWTEELEEEDV